MAHAITFSRLPSSCGACTSSTISNRGTALTNSAFERFQFGQEDIKTRSIQLHYHRKLTLVMTSRSDVHPTPRSHSPGERAKQLYECINEKNLKALDEIISKDCCFEDSSFPTTFNGNKVSCVLANGRIHPTPHTLPLCSFFEWPKAKLTQEVLLFFAQLTSSMGKNVRFILKNVSEDEDMAWVNWHLEWKGNEIPFTRGCSFYECSKDGERLVIRKALVFVESPIKPGGIVLILLKTITSLFDDFPTATERFLKSPSAIVQWAKRIYNMFLAPFISPLLACYINSWKFMSRILGYALGVIILILKLFFN